MNASDWEKAAAFISQHKHAAATAQTELLSSMPLSALSLDDSCPPMVQYGLHEPLAASTPNSTPTHMPSPQQEHSYQEIIPGIPQGSLYPTLSSLSSDPVASATNEMSLCSRVIKGFDQYLQEAQQLWDSEDNYFDGVTRSTNMSPLLETDEQADQTLKKELVPTKQLSLEVKQSMDEILESQQTDTSHCPQQSAKAKGTVQEGINLDTNLLYEQSQSEDGQDFTEEDTLVLIPDGSNDGHQSTTTDDTGKCTIIKMSKQITDPPTFDEVSMPIEKVGCIFLTIHLHKYLDEYLLLSHNQAFLNVSQMLLLLDCYLTDNPR